MNILYKNRTYMLYQQGLKVSKYQAIYSPRAGMKRYLDETQAMKTNMTINIDKQILALFKNEFEAMENKMTMVQFVATGKRTLKSWQKDLPERSTRIIKYLSGLFEEIENKHDGSITWEQFNNAIIEKALNLKSLQTQESGQMSLLKSSPWTSPKVKFSTPVQKLLILEHQNKLTYLCEESNKIQFLPINSSPHVFKPLILEKQELVVEKLLNRRIKQTNQQSKHSLTVKESYKKDVVVADYKIIFLDMIYLHSAKYDMLLTSSSDRMVRGWNIGGTTPSLSKQPQNEDEKMIHQFPTEIYCMAWDDINQILYCSGKNSRIYLWLIKTDSQRELYDPSAHGSMISSMIMMPKLQFLATGGYDGKLVLWDAISLNKKFKYEEHTRSIVSMTFHDGLILLFTAAFDHSICVWNPYIPSLIYKIVCNINVISVSIIPNTNYIAALDCSSCVKIREINKFTLVSSYVVDRPEEQPSKHNNEEKDNSYKIEPTGMVISEQSRRFFFGGNSVKCLEFDEHEAFLTADAYPTHIHYIQSQMKLYITVKNNITVMDVLTGRPHETLSHQTENQITAVDFIADSGLFVVGDTDGSVYVRKVENGIKISKLYTNKNKAAITHILSRKGSLWNEQIIIICCQDGEIVVFGVDQMHDYIHLRTLNGKKTHPNISIESVEYEAKRNIIMLGTNQGEILFLDVDKNKITHEIKIDHCEILAFLLKLEMSLLLCLTKKYEIYTVYLPPHSKKFKIGTHLVAESSHPVSVVIKTINNNRYFFASDHGVIERVNIPSTMLTGQKAEKKVIYPDWTINLEEHIKDMILIENQTILVVIVHGKTVFFISTEDGSILNHISNTEGIHHQPIEPVCYFNEEGLELYVPKEQKYTSIKKQLQDVDASFYIHHDPQFLYDLFMKKCAKGKQSVRSNPFWKIFPEFKHQIGSNLEFLQKMKSNIQKYDSQVKVRKFNDNKNRLSHKRTSSNLQKVRQIQKQWQKSKQEQDQGIKLKNKSSYTQSMFKNESLHKKEEQEKNYQTLCKYESSPMIRLGYALQSIDDKDQKAIRFIQMGRKTQHESKQSLKLPKIK